MHDVADGRSGARVDRSVDRSGVRRRSVLAVIFVCTDYFFGFKWNTAALAIVFFHFHLSHLVFCNHLNYALLAVFHFWGSFLFLSEINGVKHIYYHPKLHIVFDP